MGLIGPPAAVLAQKVREHATHRRGTAATESPRSVFTEPTSASPDRLTPSQAPVNTGPPRDVGADAFKKACLKQKEESKAVAGKVGILGVASLANEPGESVPRQDAKGPRNPLPRKQLSQTNGDIPTPEAGVEE